MPENSAASNFKPRILVLLEAHEDEARLLRVAKRKAEVEGLDWEVIVINNPFSFWQRSKEYHYALLKLRTLADELGAIVTDLSTGTLVGGLRRVLSERRDQGVPIYSVKIGDPSANPLLRLLRKQLYSEIRSAVGVRTRFSTVPLGVEGQRALFSGLLRDLLQVSFRDILISLFAVVVATFCIEMLDFLAPEVIGPHNRNKPIIYMIACAFAAGRFGLLAGIIASVASFLTLNLLYYGAYMSLIIENRTDAVNLGLYLLASLMISVMGSRDYSDRLSTTRESERFHSLLKVHRFALGGQSLAEAVSVLDKELKALLGTEVVFFLPNAQDSRRLETIYFPHLRLNIREKAALDVCWDECKTTGVGAPYNPEGCQWRFEPLVTANNEIGVLGVRIIGGMEYTNDFWRLMSGVADQVALILERMQVGQAAADTQVQAEREKLRAMLLSSVSHDLKTPLASVIGSLSAYRSMSGILTSEQKETLLSTALDEAQRLDSFITNILDITRIESGQIELKKEWIDPQVIIGEVLSRLRLRLREHPVEVSAPEVPIQVKMDSVMTGQVLQNLLDNAAKYTASGTQIEVRTYNTDDGGFAIEVRDYGQGIPEASLEKVFDKYERINKQDSQVAGTGLGLAIAKAVMQAQGGNITVSNHPQGGAVFTLYLPEYRYEETQLKKYAER